ncbi:GNAT family N-acetyltransferase [Janthinobacterium fluminis]|uniref:GNAT family N-acetyltransferase n=1 Tax=Janthinobacterium fluminis TaxID=2987524 RepID=A0ABT5K8T8_9BURK|nr:GNAT family N-acetyltransferase [Janthinobacterium fluminis]MDC8760197.1 GNAT family N-acetyltransferase [Janthinobacterium fluminis]
MTPLSSRELCLRPYEEGDAAAFAAAVRESVATVGRWMPWCHDGYTLADALDWFAFCARERASGAAHEFGVFSADGGELLGGAGLNQINRQHNFCNLGYWVRQSRQRRGVATRAVQALAAFGFAELALTRIEIVVAQGNAPSDAVARKAGGHFECLARNRLLVDGQPVAASVFALFP